jgi:hypothetical protein
LAEVVKIARLVRVTRMGEFNSIPEHRNCVLKVTQLAEAFETKKERTAEVVKTSSFVGVTMRGEVNSIPVPRNCVLEVSQLP